MGGEGRRNGRENEMKKMKKHRYGHVEVFA